MTSTDLDIVAPVKAHDESLTSEQPGMKMHPTPTALTSAEYTLHPRKMRKNHFITGPDTARNPYETWHEGMLFGGADAANPVSWPMVENPRAFAIDMAHAIE